MSSQENKKRPSTTEAPGKPGKKSRFDPRNIAAPPATVKVEGARRSTRQIPSSSSSSSSVSSKTVKPSSSASSGPGNKTVADDSSSDDEVFECALVVNPSQAVEMASSKNQKKRATAALIQEVSFQASLHDSPNYGLASVSYDTLLRHTVFLLAAPGRYCNPLQPLASPSFIGCSFSEHRPYTFPLLGLYSFLFDQPCNPLQGLLCIFALSSTQLFCTYILVKDCRWFSLHLLPLGNCLTLPFFFTLKLY